jgi:hypothetical protein
MAMHRAGTPASAVDSMLNTLQSLRHYVRTAYGDSTTCFDAAQSEQTIHGIGQGNGPGPAIWALVSTPIFNNVRQRGYGVFIKTAISGHTSSLVVGIRE